MIKFLRKLFSIEKDITIEDYQAAHMKHTFTKRKDESKDAIMKEIETIDGAYILRDRYGNPVATTIGGMEFSEEEVRKFNDLSQLLFKEIVDKK